MFCLRSAAAAALLGLAATVASAAPVTYTIVTKLSRVTFHLEHQGFIQLFGTLRIAPGSFSFDADDWSKSEVAVTLPVKSLDMGDAVWNGQIRGDVEWARLFKTDAIAFRSTRLARADANHGTLQGELTLAGVTRPVTLQLQFNRMGRNEVSEHPSVGFTASTTLKRSQFGLDAYSDLVGDDIAVQIQMEAAVGADVDAGADTTAPGVRR